MQTCINKREVERVREQREREREREAENVISRVLRLCVCVVTCVRAQRRRVAQLHHGRGRIEWCSYSHGRTRGKREE